MTTVDLTKELGDALNRESERRVIAQFTGADPALVAGELRVIIEAAITNDPRSLQTRVGPSGLGVTCERCLAHMIAETPQRPEAAWLPACGRAIHEWLEKIMLNHEYVRHSLGMDGRYLPENKINVGTVGGVQISGSTDVLDVASGTVVDWKYVGVTTLRTVKGSGASAQYRHQGNIYGKGWEDAGYTVKSILIYFLPRNGLTLADAVPFQFDYDRADAENTLARANVFANDIATHGLAALLATLPPHDGSGFSCKRFADWTSPSINPDDPFGSTK